MNVLKQEMRKLERRVIHLHDCRNRLMRLERLTEANSLDQKKAWGDMPEWGRMTRRGQKLWRMVYATYRLMKI